MTQQQSIQAHKWQRPERTPESMNHICGESFKAVKIPAMWKFKEYRRIRITEDEDSEIQSIVAVFVDMSTSGFDLKHYRLIFHTYSESLSLCEVSFKDYGKPEFKSLLYNKKPEGINEFLKILNNIKRSNHENT